MAVAVGLAAYAAAQRFVRHQSPSAAGTPVEGFAGWLLVLAIGQWFAVLSLFGEMARQVPLYRRYLALPETHTVVIAEIVVPLAVIAFVLWAAVMMMRKSRLYPSLLRIELVLLVILPALSAVWVTAETTSYVTGPKLWIAVTLQFAVTGVFAALWFVYSQHSMRMRTTFVR